MKAFVVMGRTLKAVYDELFLCVFLSLIWWLGTVLIVTAAPATVGLHQVANRIANYKRVDSSFFWEAARMQIGRGWSLYLINLVIPIIIFTSIFFYLSTTGWLRILGFVCIWLFVFVLMISQYYFPLFWQQDEPDIRLILRNSVLLALQHPLYTFLMLLFQIVLLALSTAITLPLILLAPALIAISANFALTGMLQEIGLAPHRLLLARATHGCRGGQIFVASIRSHVGDPNNDQLLNASHPSQGAGGLVCPPFLVGDVAGFAVEDVLSIVHVEHGIASLGLLFVPFRQQHRDVPCVVEDLAGDRVGFVGPCGALQPLRLGVLLAKRSGQSKAGEKAHALIEPLLSAILMSDEGRNRRSWHRDSSWRHCRHKLGRTGSGAGSPRHLSYQPTVGGGQPYEID